MFGDIVTYMKISKLHIILILLGLVFAGSVLFFLSLSDNHDKGIGGQRDEHGCLGPAGYTFVESIGACARDWEIDSEDKRQAAKIAVEYVGFKKGLTVSEVKVFKCPGCFEVILDRKIISLQNWEVSSVDELESQIFKSEEEKNDSISVLVESDFGTKIVYGTSQDVDIASLMKYCEVRGGTFNTCGSVCESETEMCIDICAFTCENISINLKK